MHLFGVDRDDIASDSFHHSTLACRFLCTPQDEPYTELLMGVLAKMLISVRKHHLHTWSGVRQNSEWSFLQEGLSCASKWKEKIYFSSPLRTLANLGIRLQKFLLRKSTGDWLRVIRRVLHHGCGRRNAGAWRQRHRADDDSGSGRGAAHRTKGADAAKRY